MYRNVINNNNKIEVQPNLIILLTLNTQLAQT